MHKTDFCYDILKDPCEYFLLANDAGLGSAAWKTSSSLGNTLQVTIPLKRLVGYWEISEKHLHFFGGPVNLYTSSSVAAQNILISRVSIWERLFALTLGNLPTGDKQLYEHFGSTN